MTDINYAELERQVWEAPTARQCWRMGSTHKAYGWACNARDYWPAPHKQAYRDGFNGLPYEESAQ